MVYIHRSNRLLNLTWNHLHVDWFSQGTCATFLNKILHCLHHWTIWNAILECWISFLRACRKAQIHIHTLYFAYRNGWVHWVSARQWPTLWESSDVTGMVQHGELLTIYHKSEFKGLTGVDRKIWCIFKLFWACAWAWKER